MNTQTLVAFFAGLLIGGITTNILLPENQHTHHDQHPIADPNDDEYHVHADFHIVVNNTLVNLDDDIFMTTSTQEPHEHLHLHDNNGDVEHIHIEDKTFVEFLSSLEIEVTNDCITLDDTYCADDENVFQLYVNNELYEGNTTDYIPLDDDSVLLYYGLDDTDLITKHLSNVPDDSCYYSGTCPERGTAPPENCGGTCEL